MAVCSGICALIMSGCSIKFGTNPKTDPKHIVAKPTRLCFTGELDITYEEFNKEYMFYLKSSGITEDSSNAELCKSIRETVIENQIYSKVLLLKAKELGCDVLTEEEEKTTREEFDAAVQNQIKALGDEADFSDLPEGTEITDEMRIERGEKEFDDILKSCKLTREELYVWLMINTIGDKMLAKYKSDVDSATAEETLNSYIEQIKDIYETDVSLYEQGEYYEFWVPEGSRRIKHVLLGFDDDTVMAIQTYRQSGDDEAADALRAEKAAELKDKQAEVEQAIDNGTDWDDILLKYSSDATGSSLYPDGYLVVPNGTAYVKEFQEAAFVPENVGDRTVCVSDYGVHIMIYASSAEITEERRSLIIDTLKTNIAQYNLSEDMDKWVEEYAFETDKKALKLEDEEESESSASSAES